MNVRMLLALALTILAISACVVEPIGGRGYGGGHEYGRGYGGGHEYGRGEYGHGDYGRGVWRG
jgi:hypothetical protein